VNGELAVREVDAATKELGSPEYRASEYLTGAALARTEASRSPFRIVASLFRWVSLSVTGFFVLISSLVDISWEER
jgi:hypothetical protein